MEIDTIQAILEHHGYNSVSDIPVGEHIKLHVEGHEDLVIEKTGHDIISVAQYYTQMGDLMADPDIVFRVIGDDWIPIEYTHHGLGKYNYSESGLPHLNGFIQTWDRALKRQGFIEAAKEQAATSPSSPAEATQ
jgi:hypothetical protein